MSAQLNLPPGRCSRCQQSRNANGKAMRIHWSRRFQKWLCMGCTFLLAEAADAELQT